MLRVSVHRADRPSVSNFAPKKNGHICCSNFPIFNRKNRVENMDRKELEKQSLDETINALAMASPFSLEEKQVLLEAKNLSIRKNKIAEILSTYTFDQFQNTTLQ